MSQNKPYTIVIHGFGPGHSGRIDIDADEIAKQLVKRLDAAGHRIDNATFATGNETTVLAGTGKPQPDNVPVDLPGLHLKIDALGQHMELLQKDLRSFVRYEKKSDKKKGGGPTQEDDQPENQQASNQSNEPGPTAQDGSAAKSDANQPGNQEEGSEG